MFNPDGHVQFCAYDINSLNNYQSSRHMCLEECNKDCIVESYTMDPNILDYGSDGQNGTTVFVSWSPENYVYIRHNERMDQFWFLGNIGKFLLLNVQHWWKIGKILIIYLFFTILIFSHKVGNCIFGCLFR